MLDNLKLKVNQYHLALVFCSKRTIYPNFAKTFYLQVNVANEFHVLYIFTVQIISTQ